MGRHHVKHQLFGIGLSSLCALSTRGPRSQCCIFELMAHVCLLVAIVIH